MTQGTGDGRGFPCEAYGDPRAGCFFAEVATACASPGQCAARMQWERHRLWGRLLELAEDADPATRAMWAEVLEGVDGPDGLLRAPETGEQDRT